MKRSLGGWGTALLLWASACGPQSSAPAVGDSSAEVQNLQTKSGAEAPFASVEVLERVAHRGVRRLEFMPADGQPVAYRERITTDGRGRYAIEPLEALRSSVRDWASFELLQRSSQGFLFRYRDFAVRDAPLFALNYTREELEPSVAIAGRICDRFRVERSLEPAIAYEVAVDPGTGLVLSWEQFDEAGQRVASMVYEEVDLAPTLENVVWHRPANQEQALDAHRGLAEQLETQVLQPRLLPSGHALRERATVVDGADRRWLKLTYSDGVEPLFFFQGLPQGAQVGNPVSHEADVSVDGAPSVAASRVVVFEVGAATAIQGTVGGFDLMVIGKAPQAELLDLIESALP